MIDAGIFEKDEHLELLHGRLVVVPPQGPPHSYVSTVLRDRLIGVFSQALVREAKPLDCGVTQVPEPDIAVVQGTASDYDKRDPRGDEALLVVEVSRTTQKTDRDKATIYAVGGVPVYWLVDVRARRIEAHTEPNGDCYRLARVIGEDEDIEVPGTSERWHVADLLPSR